MTHYYWKFLIAAALAAIATPARSHPSESPRIIAGKDAELGQFPYQAMLRIQMEKGRALCGGSLISEEWVLTAGHCVEGASSFEVHLGAIEFKEPEGGDGRTVLNSTEFIQHEEYRRETVSNDVALIKLPQRVQFSDRIQPVALPTGHDDYNRRMAIASGWGKTKDRGGAAQRLQYASLKVISNTECKLLYGPGTIQTSTLCSRGENRQSTCNGDSGGPLVLEDDRTLIGVVSFGHAIGCERRLPVAFARVTEFTEWIRNKTGMSATAATETGEGTTAASADSK